ncbi:MAG: cobalamin B12-binding domain-containing protein [Spirochaetota bacterium]
MSEPILTEQQYRAYLDDLLSGNRAACMTVVEELLFREIGVRDIYLDVFQRSLYDVGVMWEQNQISVAVEHLATAITESLLTLVYPVLFRNARVNRKAVVACVANEYHQIGGKMVADVLELHGWDSYFLGANTPTPDLMDLVSRTAPDLVGLSLAVYSRMPELQETLHQLTSRFPETRVIVGGQAFRRGGEEALRSHPGVSYVPSVEELEAVIVAKYHGA